MNRLLDNKDPILRQIAEPVADSEFKSEWLKNLIETMFSIMAETGAIGVAAPQIGVSKRVIVFSTNYTKYRKPEYPIPDTILINPSLKILSDDIQIGYEGCLNFGDLRGQVPRALEIEYSGFDLEGKQITKRVTGLEAGILQHEIDHLNGVLFVDRVEDKETLISVSALQNKG